MMSLAPADRTRLAKLLGLLGSDHAGERDAAGLAADRFLRSRNLTWEVVLTSAPAEHRMPEMGTWRQTVAKCLGRAGSLRQWEVGFLHDLPKFHRLSVKQRYVLNEIAARVLPERQA